MVAFVELEFDFDKSVDYYFPPIKDVVVLNMADSKIALLIGAATIATGTLLASAVYFLRSYKQVVYYEVGTVEKIYIYPVKSCAPIVVREADCTSMGLLNGNIRDRVFMIVDNDGVFVSAKTEARVTVIQPSYHGNELHLDAPGMDTLRVPIPTQEQLGKPLSCRIIHEEVIGFDCGEEASQWLSSYFGKEKIHLVYNPSETTDRTPTHYLRWPRFQKKDSAIFAALTPYNLLSQASLDDLSLRLNRTVTAVRFRPNFVVKGCLPYEEDSWKDIRIGDTCQFRNVRPCSRCNLIVSNPETGTKDEGLEPLATLRRYRQLHNPEFRQLVGNAPTLGIHLGIDQLGKIRIGDVIKASFE